MIPLPLFRELGGFDADNFFLYCDDVDFSWLVRRGRLQGDVSSSLLRPAFTTSAYLKLAAGSPAGRKILLGRGIAVPGPEMVPPRSSRAALWPISTASGEPNLEKARARVPGPPGLGRVGMSAQSAKTPRTIWACSRVCSSLGTNTHCDPASPSASMTIPPSTKTTSTAMR